MELFYMHHIDHLLAAITTAVVVLLALEVVRAVQDARRNHLLRSINRSLKQAPWMNRSVGQDTSKIRRAG